jgi:PEP-CTERM motif
VSKRPFYAVLMLFAATGFAAINTCPTLQTSGNVGYPLAGPGNLVFGGTTTFTGCQVVNAVFSNWTTENTNGTYIGSAVTAAQSSDPLVTAPTFRLATKRGDFSGANLNDNNDGDNNWMTGSVDGFVGGTVDFVATTTGLSLHELSFVFTGVVHGAGGTVGITPIFCLGGTATGTFTATTCTGAGGIAVSPGLTNIAGNGVQTLNFILPTLSNRVAVSFAVNLVPGTSGTAGFNYMDLDFSEAPEPSTLILLGSALAALAAAKLGKAKRNHRS